MRLLNSKKCFHSYRLWIDGDQRKGICGDCGKFIYLRRKTIYDYWVNFANFFSKRCLGCEIEEANRKRKDIFCGRNPIITFENVFREDIKNNRAKLKFVKPKIIKKNLGDGSVNIIYGHNFRCRKFYLSLFWVK